jgi:flagellar hook-associated protein 1
MSDLLSIGRSGVLAYQGALAAVGENVVNADTDGFARRQVVLKEQHVPSGATQVYRTSSAFNGVQATDVKRVWDQYKALNAWSANADANGASTRAQYLSTVQDMLSDNDIGIGVRLTSVFNAGTALAANPGDTTLRQTMLAAIGDTVQAIGQSSANLGKVAETVRTKAQTTTDLLNDQLGALSKINIALHTSAAGGSGRAQLEDQRDALIGSISSTVGVDVTLDNDGAASLKLDSFNGPVLVSSTSSTSAFVTMQPAADGRFSLTVVENGQSHAVTPTGGMMAGLVDAANNIAGRRQQLDALAVQFKTDINAWQAQGNDANGVAGADLLTGTGALTLALATTDTAKIAAADATTANGNLIALQALRGADGVEATFRAIATDQSLLVASAKTQETAASTRKESAYSSLDQVSGIDLDTEAADLLRYQQAYSASAKIIQAARETLQAILDIV